jgi:hypothetical protein
MPATIGQEASRWPRKHFKYLEPDKYFVNASMNSVRVGGGADVVVLFLAMRHLRCSDIERAARSFLNQLLIVNGKNQRLQWFRGEGPGELI